MTILNTRSLHSQTKTYQPLEPVYGSSWTDTVPESHSHIDNGSIRPFFMPSFEGFSSQIDARCSGLGDDLVRRFACACCRRIWHVIEDNRAHRALEVAERFASGRARIEDLDTARAEVADLLQVAWHAEWVAEAEANFSYNPRYCEIQARLFATLAVWYTLSRIMAAPEPDDVFFLTPRHKQSSWFWAEATVEAIERAEALRWFDEQRPGDPDAVNVSNTTARMHRIEERSVQWTILNRMIEHRSSRE
ncbi:hypothetical protein [Tautonia rosea]|uniref:hypothetical protein n=1 Tax=Tautonia rosea TaxID=2728037 RepID=UPI0014751B33|nr:hypothetical protein [Tautonia rosea]